MDWRRKGLAISGLAALLVAGLAAPAHAGVVDRSCSADDYIGRGETFYSYVSASGSNKITAFQYRLDHASSTAGKSNTNIRHREDVFGASDPTMYSWNSPDNRKFRRWYSHFPPLTIQLPSSREMFTNYSFIFDRGGTDPRCTARTQPNI